MIRIYLLSLCMTLLIPLEIMGQQPPITSWQGTLNAGGTALRLEIDITDNTGRLTGVLRSIDQGNAELQMAEIHIEGDSLRFSVPQVGAEFNGRYSKDRTTAEGTFSQGGANLPLTFSRADARPATLEAQARPELIDAWIGKLKIGLMEPVMQFRIVKRASGDTAAFFDSITEGLSGFEATWSVDADTLRFEVPKVRLQFSGRLNETRDTAEGTWHQGNRVLPFTVERKATEYDNINVWENRPQRPVGPFPYDAEEVTFENKADSLTLAGTLTIPKKPGRHPVVILLNGSGPQDRDQTIMEHKPFLVIADYLSRRGIAVLRYDDRGTAKSTGKFGGATTEAFARDASAAVAFLKNHNRINPMEIGLVGHSEGGLIAPMVVGLNKDIAFVVLLAATGVDGAAITLSQSEAMLRAAGTAEDEIAIVMAVNRAVIGVVSKTEPGSDFSGELDIAVSGVIQTLPENIREEAGKNIRTGIRAQLGRLQGDWMRFFLSYDPRPALTQITCPVLVMSGTKDLQVLPELNIPEIRKALTQDGNRDVEIVELEGLNHLFQQCETGAMIEYVSIQETFNPIALEKMGNWITRHASVLK